MAFHLRRVSSASSNASNDSLEDFLSEFEVVSKEEQAQQGPALLETRPRGVFLHTSRPPRPTVRLSSQPYQPKPRRPRQQEAASASAGRDAIPGYELQTLVPVATADDTTGSGPSTAEPRLTDPGHAPGGAPQPGAGQIRQQQPLSPVRPLEAYAEQMSADLGGAMPLSPIVSQQIPEWVTEAATAAHAEKAPSFSQPQSAPRMPAASSSAAGSHFHPVQQRGDAAEPSLPRVPSLQPLHAQQQHIAMTNPLSSLPAADRPVSGSRQSFGRQEQAQPLHSDNPLLSELPPPTVLPSHRPLATPLARGGSQQPAHWAGQHRPAAAPLSSGQAERAASPLGGAARSAGLLSQQPAPAAADRGPRQVLRKRDFESELLDRLLNGIMPPPPAAPPPPAPAPPAPSPSKPAFNALHLPVSRVLLITVVFALMGVPLLLFMAGRLQAQQAMGFSYYYSPGSGVPPSAMSAEEGVLMQAAEAALALAQATSSEANLTDENNATRHQHHLSGVSRQDEGGEEGAEHNDTSADQDTEQGADSSPDSDDRGAREHMYRRSGQSGLRLLSWKLTVTVR